MDRVWIEWNKLTNDKEKRRYCNELEEVIKVLEDEFESKNKEVEKLINSRKQLVSYLAVSIIILCLVFIRDFLSNQANLENKTALVKFKVISFSLKSLQMKTNTNFAEYE